MEAAGLYVTPVALALALSSQTNPSFFRVPDGGGMNATGSS